jgi:hypothetical protein
MTPVAGLGMKNQSHCVLKFEWRGDQKARFYG